jgi:4-hydroxybenzoate polyprenyltransferase
VNRAWHLLCCIRYREILVLQGAPVAGLVLATGKPTIAKVVLAVLFALANFFLLAHIWTLNDWADIQADALDRDKAPHVFTRNGIAPRMMFWFSIALLSVSLGLFALLPPMTFWIAVGIVLLGFFYSFPGIHAKGIVLLSSVSHLVGGFLHFLLGYSLFAPTDPHVVPTACFFALIFVAGHCVQEVQDQETDRRTGIRTNAVVFGKLPVFAAALLAFLFAYGDLEYLAWAGMVPVRLGPLALALGGLQLYWARQTLRAGLSFESVRQFRRRYRALFALIGLAVIGLHSMK